MSLYRSLRSIVGLEMNRRQYGRIYDEFKDYTMISRPDYIDNLNLARRVQDLPGCVVECGVWRGGMSAGLATVLGLKREYFLFDSFEGLPPAKDIDGDAALRWQKNTSGPNYHDNCSAGEEFAKLAMTLSGAASFHLVKGWFDKTLPNFRPTQPIALLRLDADWYESTMVCLESLFDHVLPNGIIVLDDYYAWDGCSRAVHDFLSDRSATERIRSFENICYLKKIK